MDLKYIALVALILQNCGLAVLMRMTFLYFDVRLYIPSTAVLNAEILKLVISTFACYYLDCEGLSIKFQSLLYDELFIKRMDWIKLMIPSILYTLQNSLQYYSMSCLSAPVFQVLYQMKIITTAIFSVIILAKRLNGSQWISIVSLACGVTLVQLSQSSIEKDNKTNSFMGLMSVLIGCLTSGFAGVYFEYVLKSSSASIWLRNIQLSLIGIVMSGLSCIMKDGAAIQEYGYLVGYNRLVIGVILLQAAGGLIVAVVVKYADNVLKGFATSISIILSSIVSMTFFHDVSINFGFTVGASIVLGSVYLYGYQPNNGGHGNFKGLLPHVSSPIHVDL